MKSIDIIREILSEFGLEAVSFGPRASSTKEGAIIGNLVIALAEARMMLLDYDQASTGGDARAAVKCMAVNNMPEPDGETA